MMIKKTQNESENLKLNWLAILPIGSLTYLFTFYLFKVHNTAISTIIIRREIAVVLLFLCLLYILIKGFLTKKDPLLYLSLMFPNAYKSSCNKTLTILKRISMAIPLLVGIVCICLPTWNPPANIFSDLFFKITPHILALAFSFILAIKYIEFDNKYFPIHYEQ